MTTTVPTTHNSSSSSTTTTTHDDVDLMLHHECFSHLLDLTIQIHQAYQIIHNQTGQPYQTQQYLPNNSLTLEETMHAIMCLQQKLMFQSSTTPSSSSTTTTTIHRGQYPITDAIMDDSLRILQQELKDIQDYIQDPWSKRKQTTTTTTIQTNHSKTKGQQQERKQRRIIKGERGGGIAIKYSKWQTDILMQWMVDHTDEPFPDPNAVLQLMIQTGLSQSQVVNWTTNVRKRNKKATCQGGKKPHHFIDFLFLVQDREKKKQDQYNHSHNHNYEDDTTTRIMTTKSTINKTRMMMMTPSSSRSFSNITTRAPIRTEFHSIEQDQQQQQQELLDPFLTYHSEEMNDDLMKEFAHTWLQHYDHYPNHQSLQEQQQQQQHDDNDDDYVDDSSHDNEIMELPVLGDALDIFMAEYYPNNTNHCHDLTLFHNVTDDTSADDEMIF